MCQVGFSKVGIGSVFVTVKDIEQWDVCQWDVDYENPVLMPAKQWFIDSVVAESSLYFRENGCDIKFNCDGVLRFSDVKLKLKKDKAD